MARSGTAWSVKGIDTETRGIARLRAGEAGLTIGAWVDQAILSQARREADPEALVFVSSVETSLIDSSEAVEPAPQGPGADLALLAMIDQELEASRLRVDESLRPVGFALRDLALQLVAAEFLQTDGPVRKTADSHLVQPAPGPEGQFPPPPLGSLHPLIRPEELTPPGRRSSDDPTDPLVSADPPASPIPTPPIPTPPIRAAPQAPTGDLSGTISGIEDRPSLPAPLGAISDPVDHPEPVEASISPRRPQPIPPTGPLGAVDASNLPAPPEPAPLSASPAAPADLERPDGYVDIPAEPEGGSEPEEALPVEDPPTLVPPPDEVRFTGLQTGFESDPQRATAEARKTATGQTKRVFRIAAGLAPVLLFATAALVYFFADSLGIGVVRDNLRSIAAQHIHAAGKTLGDAYHAADKQVADLLKTTTARQEEAPSMDRAAKQHDQASADPDSTASPPPVGSILVAPKPNESAHSTGKRTTITALPTRTPKSTPKVARAERAAPIRPPRRAGSGERTVVAGLPAAPSVDRRPRADGADQEAGGIPELRRRARAGDASAQHELARRLIQGDGVEQNFNEGADWFREAAIQGVANAQYNLGVLYERGLGVTKDDVRALLWYHSAAEQSHPLAQYNLGNFYLQGRGIPLSYAEAVRWFKAASDQGVAKATYNLAVLTEDGLGVPPDLDHALTLYEKAAASGHRESANRLAVLRDPGGKELKPATFDDTADTQARGATIGSTVADIQAILQRQDIYLGRIDGIAGPGTRTAIRAYQRLHALPITGIPSEFLLDYMKISESTGAKPIAG